MESDANSAAMLRVREHWVNFTARGTGKWIRANLRRDFSSRIF
jgi:hypothetical protein